MPHKQPLADWEEVSRSVNNPLTSTISFSVTDDGIWTEKLTGLFPSQPKPDTGQLKKWEFRVLDALIDQINREPIPDQMQCGPPTREELGVFLGLTNDETTYQLRAGNCIRADDLWDGLEIAALDEFLRYLSNKYGRFSEDSLLG